MPRTTLVHAAVLLSCLGGATAAIAATGNSPTVVELYQSQGCSSCPPADAVLNRLADRPDVLALNFAVTYWDRLGWKDSFAKPAFTQRQWDYANAGGRGQVATPQVIVNGRGVLTGNTMPAVQAAVARFDRGGSDVPIAVAGDVASIGGRVPAGATLWLVGYDPRTIAVSIGAGENSGRTIPHRNVVRSLVAVGRITGAGAKLRLPARAAPYRYALLVQQRRGGAILGAHQL